jgi:hypothetical protein
MTLKPSQHDLQEQETRESADQNGIITRISRNM